MKKRLILLAVILALLLAIWVIPAGAEEIVEIEYLPDDEIIEFSAGASALLNSDADTWQSDWNTYKDQLTGYAVQFYESLEATFLDDELKQKSVLTIDGYVLCWDMTHYPFESKSFKAATDAAAYDAYALWMTENQIVPSMTAAAIAFTNDYPEFFWIRHAFVPAMQTSKRTYYSNDVAVAVEYVTNPRLFFAVQHMTQTTSEIDAYQTSLDATVQAIMAQTTGMRPDEKVALFDQWLAANVHYDCAAVNAGAEVDETPWSVVGSLVTGQAVCEGYAKALQLLCHEAGIPCVTVSGWGTGNGKTEKHMWAAVKLDGLWYFCDPTWDDPVHYPNQTESTKNTSTGEYLLIGQPASHATEQELIAPDIAEDPYVYAPEEDPDDPPKEFVVDQTTGQFSGTETSTEQVQMFIALYDDHHRMIACGVCEEKIETTDNHTAVYIYSAPDFDVEDVKTAHRVVRFILKGDHTPKSAAKNLIG